MVYYNNVQGKYTILLQKEEKTIDGETTKHIWQGQQIVVDVTVGGNHLAKLYTRGTNLAATYDFYNGQKTLVGYYHQNAHGDVVNLTGADSKIIKTYKYDDFGVEKNIVENDTNPFRYCGEYFDTETGTIYLRARHYNPNSGRFTQRDSHPGKNEDPLSLNLYTYCRNNPIRYVDPSGHSYAEYGNGKRMTINSPGDVKALEKKRSGAPGCSVDCGPCGCAAHKGVSVVLTEGQGKGERLRASAKVYRDGELLKSFDMASTLPDYPYGTWNGEEVATVKEGMYGIKIFSYDHNESGNYSSPNSPSHPNSFLVYNLETGNDDDIPCYYGQEQKNGTANSILIHQGVDYRASNEDRAWSAGCILIEESNMNEFFDLVRANMVDGTGKLYIVRPPEYGKDPIKKQN